MTALRMNGSEKFMTDFSLVPPPASQQLRPMA
jgi:hypothetical protein